MKFNIPIENWTGNSHLINWIEENIKLCRPKRVHLCDGSQNEYDDLVDEMVKNGTAILLNEQKRPGSIWFRSNPDDTARVEESTFICSKHKDLAGPTNNWKDPFEMKSFLQKIFKGSMQGRTMYVIPFCMGPLGSDKSHIGVEITDSPYVVINMRIMTRMGSHALRYLKTDGFFVPCLHSVGKPLKENEKDELWPCNPQNRYIVHFPEEKSIFSFGSGYGGNALLGKKCFALRIASVMAKEQGWLAEHMLILGITNPKGEKKYFAAAFPSACGKTNMAMLNPTLKGWKVECVGDDIAWMKFSSDGQLYAINPEAGFFGVAPGTSYETNFNAMKTIEKNTIFTNVGLTRDKDIWWEGMTKNPPENLTSWLNENYNPLENKKAAHPNARFTAPAKQCPIIDPNWESTNGVPISAILFGGRRDNTVPLVNEAFDWDHGVFLGASISSQTTAAAKGIVGALRHDPFAMLPFCGYHMGDYFSHWFDIKNKHRTPKLPKIYYVNWFGKNDKGEFLWPGFGDNVRVLKWIFERTDGKVGAKKTEIGYLPNKNDLDLTGMELKDENLASLLQVDKNAWASEVLELEKYFAIFGNKLPAKISEQLERLKQRLNVHENCCSKS